MSKRHHRKFSGRRLLSERKGLRLLLLQYLSVWSLSFFIENSPASGISNFMTNRNTPLCAILSSDVSKSESLSSSASKETCHSKSPNTPVKVVQNLAVKNKRPLQTSLPTTGVKQWLKDWLGIDPFEPLTIPSEAIHSFDKVSTQTPDIYSRNDFRGVFLNLRIDESKGAVASWPLGKANALRFLCLHRFKIWWMKPLHTAKGRSIPPETQLLLAELPPNLGANTKQPTYCVFVPMIDGNAKFSLKGTQNDILQLRAETGDLDTKLQYGSLTGLFVGVDTDPFHLLKTAFEKIAERIQNNFGIERSCNTVDLVSQNIGACLPEIYSKSTEVEDLVSPYANTTDELIVPPMPRILEYGSAVEGKPSIPEISTPPPILESFGWCTWDSFYTQVTPNGVKEGLISLRKTGFAPKWMVLDDGWQSTTNPDAKNEEQWLLKLTSLKANYKFRDEEDGSDLGDLVKEVKKDFGISQFLVWHALAGYWAGVEKNNEMEKYGISENLAYSPEKLIQVDTDLWKFIMFTHVMNKKMGMVHPDRIKDFYDDYHGYLQEQGVDGIKVDAQSSVNVMGTGMGGSVKVAHAYHKGLWESATKRFALHSPGKAEATPNLIHCMCHDSEILLLLTGLYSHRPIVRGSDDHYPRDKASHGPHLYNNAFNSLLISFVGLQDWDMFQTNLGKESWLHAAARAISGGPVYISDRPGQHNPGVLSKLVLDDGSILRSKHNALPTVNSLFEDPQSSQTLLSVWNTNYLPNSGVVGVFNINGASWNQRQRKYWIHSGLVNKDAYSVGFIKPSDVHSTQRSAGTEYAIYLHNRKRIFTRRQDEHVKVGVSHMDFEIATISPIYTISLRNKKIQWSAIGLSEKFNSGASVLNQKIVDGQQTAMSILKIKGSGKFLSLCSREPKSVYLVEDDVSLPNENISTYIECLPGIKSQKLEPSFSVNEEGIGFLEYIIPLSVSKAAHRTVLHFWDSDSI